MVEVVAVVHDEEIGEVDDDAADDDDSDLGVDVVADGITVAVDVEDDADNGIDSLECYLS